MPLRYGSQQNSQGENWSTPSQTMSTEERERLRNRFGNTTFWQGHDDRVHTQARGRFPTGNPFDPRPEQRQSSTSGRDGPAQGSHQQTGQYIGYGQQPQNNQHHIGWQDDEGYSSGGEQVSDMRRPQNNSQGGHRNTPQGSSQGSIQGSIQGYAQSHYQYGHGYAPQGAHNAAQRSYHNYSQEQGQDESEGDEWIAPQSAHRTYGRNSRSASHRGPRSSFYKGGIM